MGPDLSELFASSLGKPTSFLYVVHTGSTTEYAAGEEGVPKNVLSLSSLEIETGKAKSCFLHDLSEQISIYAPGIRYE